MKTPEEWGKIYKENYAKYKEHTNNLRTLIIELTKKNNIEFSQMEYRTKEVDKFIEKIKREEKKYKNPLKEVTDLVGIRIIAYYKEDVDEIVKIIENEFEIDWENSIDKAQALEPDRFGYLSINYVVSLSSPRKELTEWKAFADKKAEIQVRTVLQHAWAAIDHKLRYKTPKEVPKHLRRKLFCLSALLELADGEFSNLRKHTDEIEELYKSEIKEGRLDIELDLLSLDIYLEFTKRHLEWMKIAGEIGYSATSILDKEKKKRLKFFKSIFIKSLYLIGITTIKELDKELNNASKWGKGILVKFDKIFHKINPNKDALLNANPFGILLVLLFYAKKPRVSKKILNQTGLKKIILETIKELLKIK